MVTIPTTVIATVQETFIQPQQLHLLASLVRITDETLSKRQATCWLGSFRVLAPNCSLWSTSKRYLLKFKVLFHRFKNFREEINIRFYFLNSWVTKFSTNTINFHYYLVSNCGFINPDTLSLAFWDTNSGVHSSVILILPLWGLARAGEPELLIIYSETWQVGL